jgi:hypothetical protein
MAYSSRSDEEPEDVLELQVVQAEGRAGGRPLFLDARRFIRICHWIERGESAVEACRRECVSYESLRRRVCKNSKFQRRLKLAEEVREHFLREFHISNIKRHSIRSLAASMFWLERRYPNEFALRPVIRDTGDSREPAVFDKISLEQLIENARLAAEIAANPPSGLVQAPELTEGKSDEGRAAG